jgi:hypothetical protein
MPRLRTTAFLPAHPDASQLLRGQRSLRASDGPQRPGRAAILAASLLAGFLSAQPTASRPAATPVVAVIGASVSAGFVDPRPREDGERNSTVDVKTVLKGLWPDGKAEIRARNGLMLPMFTDAVGLGTKQVDAALRDQPQAVVAVDFLFWFGYGPARARDEIAFRHQRLEQGLALLDRFTCPCIVGDFPDMHGADPQMLPPRAIPSEEALAALNARVTAWAKERKHVALFPLARWVRQLKTEGELLQVAGRELSVPPLFPLQGDRLHATRLGMAMLGQRIHGSLTVVLPRGHELLPAGITIEALIDATGARSELETLKGMAATSRPGK